MKRLLVSALVALSLPLVTPPNSASAATSSCTKVGSTKIVSGTTFACRLVSKKRVWVKVAAGKTTTSTVPKGPAPTVRQTPHLPPPVNASSSRLNPPTLSAFRDQASEVHGRIHECS
ncbi:MAG: hypothetical protein EBQ75_09550 [Actinobacteria bacterium]|nr:hypothetical protein [Actinomycetota bacterium]